MFEIREVNIAIELWGVAFSALGILCTLLFGRAEGRYRNLFIAFFSLELVAAGGDAMAGIYRAQPGAVAWTATHLGNFATFAGNIFLLAIFTSYLLARLEDVGGTYHSTLSRVVWAVAGIMCVLTALGAFYTIDEHNVYQRGSFYWVTLVYPLVVGATDASVVIYNRHHFTKTAFACLLFYLSSPILAMAVQIYVYGLNFLIIVGILSGVMLFLETQASSARMLVERTEELARSRVEVSEGRIAVMVSQIQPHFIFNTLDSIYYLCAEDPERAQEAVDMFSTYLRANLASLTKMAPVPIETELAHVRTYLELEQLSMEGLLNWDIDVQAQGFLVPALALQTLAENAVKHGVGKRPGGGHVTVRTREDRDCWLATVEDDGMGFDTTLPIGEGHVGLENTRQRLKALCGGTLEVTSAIGRGTTAVIRIPKQAS